MIWKVTTNAGKVYQPSDFDVIGDQKGNGHKTCHCGTSFYAFDEVLPRKSKSKPFKTQSL